VRRAERLAALDALEAEVVDCRACPRLVAWREEVARVKRASFAGEEYWGRPIPGFGDPDARVVVLGLAPAAHGGNRTGRMFTGDRSGDFLFRAMYEAGFANQPNSDHKDDGLKLIDAAITGVAHCAPPGNKPTTLELAACGTFLERTIELMPNLQCFFALGRIAFDACLRTYRSRGWLPGGVRPVFAHGAAYHFPEAPSLVASFHPSQQNTFTGRLTEPMLDAVFIRAGELRTEVRTAR